MTAPKIFGLLGRNIQYSFSKKYFTDRFEKEQLPDHQYQNFDVDSIFGFKKVIETENLVGLNVTIPYKQEVIPFLDKLSNKAKKIGAVNTIRFTKSGKTKGYNTDWFGFKKAIEKNLKPYHKKALILGTGGSSKAIAYAFESLDIEYAFMSRNKTIDAFCYEDLNEALLSEYTVIVNCTPIGTSPNIEACPNIPFEHLTSNHLVFDLIYNPAKTMFLQKAEQQGATILNGLNMLVYQAEKAWEIWNR